MAESKATVPHFYLQAEIDMSRAVEARARIKAADTEGEVVPSFNDMVVKACALALRDHPRANGAYRDGRFELYSRINVGIAVAAQDALVVPTIFDADKKGLRQIATDSRALAQKIRHGKITPPELSGGTFTVSNLGMFGIDNFSAVINAPQAAILAVGAIKERPVVREGELTTAHLMGVTSPATIASSTAPRWPSSWRRSAACSKSLRAGAVVIGPTQAFSVQLPSTGSAKGDASNLMRRRYLRTHENDFRYFQAILFALGSCQHRDLRSEKSNLIIASRLISVPCLSQEVNKTTKGSRK